MSGCIEDLCRSWGLTPWQIGEFLPDWEAEACDCGCETGWRIRRPERGIPSNRPVKTITNTLGIPTPRKGF